MKQPIQFKFLRLELRSFILDWQLLACRFPIAFRDKCEFLFKKYLLITKHYILHFQLNPMSDKVSLGKRNYFYGSAFGMVVFQSMIVTIDKYIVLLLENINEPVVVDVGAHLGFFSIPLASTLKKSIIYALEPVSVTFNLLKENTQHLNAIKTFCIGLGNKSEKTTIYYNPELLMYSSLFRERFKWDKNPHKEIVDLQTLDSFCKDNNITDINLLKIDAEGAEERILRGGSKTLFHTQYLFLECSLDQVDHSTFTSLISCLTSETYNFQLIKITSTLKDEKGRLLLVNMIFENLLFTKQ
ncbi:FkbM family methyltransferase [Candidatus Woesebacteria bacterium]|nr:FkbM family methyltransferase [Candidatus Woesebacteria bacterium]